MRTPRRRLLATTPNAYEPRSALLARLHRRRRRYALNRQLIDSLTHGDTETALVLVNAGTDPNTRYALLPIPSLKRLLQQHLHHAPPIAQCLPTAFMIACDKCVTSPHITSSSSAKSDESLVLLRAMLAHGANVDTRTFQNLTALHYAAWRGRWQIAELLVQHGADVNVQDKWGQTPLMVPAWNDTIQVARLVLAHGADPNIQDVSGVTVLHNAIGSEIAESLLPELLAHGADPTLYDKDGDTPLSFAQELGRSDLVALMRRDAK